jgi:hypothetical protein
MIARGPEGSWTAVLGALGLLAGATASAAASAPSWSISPPGRDALVVGDTVEVAVPADLSPAQLASIAVEIDQIDVTAITRIGGGKIVYAPPQPLSLGAHDLRVVEYAANGEIIPRGDWKFTETPRDKPAAGTRGWTVKGSVGVTASERIAESNLSQPAPPRFTINGTFDLKAARTMAEWSAEATLKGLYGTDNGTSAVGGQAVLPAQMQLALRHGKDNLIVGDQTIPFDNLAIGGLSRRGISGHLAVAPLDADATVFSVRDSSLAGFYGGLGIGDSSDIVSGGVLQAHPIPGLAKALTLQAGAVTGTSPGGLSTVVPYPGGNGSFPPGVPAGGVTAVQSGSGSAWFVAANSEIPATGLKLNAQFASSSFDFPASSGEAATHADDNAYGYGLNFSHALTDRWAFTATGTYQQIGTFFTSLANPTLAPDRRSTTGTATVSGDGLTVAASDGVTEDNTDHNPALATVRSLPRSLSLTYAPTLPIAVTSWLGTPSLNASRQDARTHDVELPGGAQPTDSDVVNGTVTLNFAYPHLSWQIGVTDGDFRDYTSQQDNTHSIGPTFGLNLTLGGSGFLALNLQLLDTHDLTQDTHTLDHNYSLTGGDSFWDNRLSAQLSVSVNHNTQQIIPGSIPPQLVGSDVVLKTASAQLTWHAIPATKHRGGLDVGLASSWNDSSGLNTSALTTQGFAALATRGFQGFLTLSTRWPLEMGDP